MEAPFRARLRRHSSAVCSTVQAPMEAPLTALLEVLERATQGTVKAHFKGVIPAPLRVSLVRA